MKYNFDTIIDRASLGAGKWKYAPEGTIPLTVADMDFKLAPEIIEAVKECADRGEFGYVNMNDYDFNAVVDWVKKRNGATIKREHLLGTPGVLYAARISMYALTEPGDKVVVHLPLHTPSINTASLLGRERVTNNLIYENGKYTMDFDHLEKCFKDGAKVFMLCAPHNPTGRVWTRDELLNVAYLANKYNVYIISDEIHRDIVWGDNVHISPSEMPELMDRSISVFSTSKSFNMGGFHIGTAVVPNDELRKKLDFRFYYYGHTCHRPTLLCAAAQTAAYTKAEDWYKEMKDYVYGNIKLAQEYLADTPIRPNNPEGTFLLWHDISELGFDTDKLNDVMLKDWKVLCDRGSIYESAEYATYKGPERHMRMNMAAPRPLIEDALNRIRNYFK